MIGEYRNIQTQVSNYRHGKVASKSITEQYIVTGVTHLKHVIYCIQTLIEVFSAK